MAESYSDYFRQLSEGSKKKSGRRSKGGGYVLPSSEDFPVSVADSESFKKLLGQLGSVQRSKLGLAALGQKPKTEPNTGFLTTLLGQEKGILTAPFRFVSALASDVLNLPVQDEVAQEALAKYNPLEAAARSAVGQFAVTGGDIFKVKEDDSFIEKLGKYAGALAFDITLDPINYFGPQALFGRKAASTLIVQQGDRILPALVSSMAEEGLDSTQVVDKLFKTSKAYKAAEAGDVIYRDRFGIVDGVVTNTTQRNRTAAQNLASYLGESFYKSGRQGVRKAIIDLTGSSNVADRMFKLLPEEVSGGIFLKNPITGKAIKRVAGGTGKSIPGFEAATELANAARFRIATSPPGQFITENFNTRLGPTFARVKKGMIGGVNLGDTDRTLLYEYVNFKRELQKYRIDQRDLGKEAMQVLSAARGARSILKDDTERAAYDLGITTRFNNPQLDVDQNATMAQKAGAEKADEIKALMTKRHQEMKDANMSIGDLGPNHVPTRWTPEHRKWLREQGFDTGTDEYSIAQGRVSEVRFMDPEEAKLYGFTDPNDPDIVYLTGAKLNEINGLHPAGHKIWLDDPIVIAADYLESTGRALSAQRFANGLRAADVLFTISDDITKVMQSKNTSFLIASLESVPEKTRTYWAEIEEQNEEKLRQVVDKAEFLGTQQAARYERASSNHELANLAVDDAQARLSEVNATVRDLRPRVAQIRQDVDQLRISGAAAAEAEARRIERNAQSRTTKAGKRQQEVEQAADNLASMLPPQEMLPPLWRQQVQQTLGPDVAEWSRIAQETDQQALAARIKFEEESINLDQAKAQLADAKAYRESITDQVTAERMQELQAFEQALADQVAAVSNLEAAREARRAAAREMTEALKDTSLSRAYALRQLTDDYKAALTGFNKVRSQIKKPVRKMTKEEYKIYDRARRILDKNRELLRKMVGYGTRKDTASLSTEYYKLLMGVVNELSSDELRALRGLADADQLDNFVESLRGVDPTTQMQAIGDMVATYRSIRRRIKPEDIKRFADMDADVLYGSPLKARARITVEKRGVGAFVSSQKKQSKVVEKLYDKEGFVRFGSGENKGTIRVPLSLKDSYAARGVIDVLEEMHRVQESPTEWQTFITKLYDPLALVWKTGATAARGPAFILNNIVGGIYNNYLGGVSARDHALSARALSKMLNITRKIQKENPEKSMIELTDLVANELRKVFADDTIADMSVGDLMIEFLRRGGQLGTDTAWQLKEMQRLGLETATKIKETSLLNPRYATEPTNLAMEKYLQVASYILDNRVQRVFNDWSQNSEVFLRFAAFLSGWRRYQNLDSAMDLTYMLHFDYQDLSNAEVWLKRFMPFYTWTRNNVPLQFRSLFIAPDKVGKIFNITENAKETFGVDGDAAWLDDYLPDWLSVQGGFVSDFKFGGNHLALYSRLPLTDLDRMFAVGFVGPIPVLVPRRDEFISTLGPAVKTPVEFLTNRNFTFGYEYKSTSEMLMAQARNLLPYVGTGKRLLSAAGLPIEQEKRLSNLINVLLGAPYGTYTINEKALFGEAWRDSVALSAQLKRAAVEANVDFEWLSKELSKGRTLDQLIALIISGQGSLERQGLLQMIKDAEKAKKGESRDYARILEGLQSGQLYTGN